MDWMWMHSSFFLLMKKERIYKNKTASHYPVWNSAFALHSSIASALVALPQKKKDNLALLVFEGGRVQ